MKKLLIFVDWFVPGYKAGGQIRSCANLAFALQDVMEIFVVTTDRDMGDEEPYQNVRTDGWITENNIRVLYLSPQKRGFKSIQSIIRSVRPDCIYLNSMFSFSFTLLPIEVCRYDNLKTKIILAPRGMLHKGALQYKNFKKKVFFHAFKVRGFQKRIDFHATDVTEETDIKKIFGSRVKIEHVNDFPASHQPLLETRDKHKNNLSCLFVSRVSPKKNLLFLLSVLKEVRSNVLLSIAGPIESKEYWLQCEKLIRELPENIRTEYIGPVPNQQLTAVYRLHHLFFLPTFGENFGHVIFDAFLNGRPALISDHTPWRRLKDRKIGWDISLLEKKQFIEAVEEAAGWGQSEFDEQCRDSWNFAHHYLHGSDLKKEYLQLFGQ